MRRIDHIFVNGARVRSASDRLIENVSPHSEEVVTIVPDADREDVDSAVEAARSALSASNWRGLSLPDRLAVLEKFADGCDARAEQLAAVMTTEMGCPGRYFTGDGGRRDEDGCYWITGRVDDVINVSGHRMGTAEVESALVAHPKVAEAAVVGMPHDIKGQGIYAYVTLNAGEAGDDALRGELVQWARKEIGPIASPDVIHFALGLPKNRSGKIMRRILRKIAEGDTANLGDTSTLADPGLVQHLLEGQTQ